MEMAGEILGQLLAACVGTAAFSALFGVPKKYWLDCGICGAVGWGVYLAIYYTAYNFFMGQEALALQYGMDTIKMAVAIGLGIGAAYSLPGHLFGWKREIEVWEPGKEGKK